jgi:hypothetical protein
MSTEKSTNPRNIEDAGLSTEQKEKPEIEREDSDDEEGYDILPSNSTGLTGDEGEEVLPAEDDE